MRDPPKNPEALTAILDQRCGHEIEFRLHKYEEDYAAQRTKTYKLLHKLKKHSRELLADDQGDVFAFSVALDDLFPEHVAPPERQRLMRDVLAAVMALSDLPTLSKPGGRLEADRVARKVIRAIREYWETYEGPFSGGPKRRTDQTWADNAVEQGSPVTRLIGEVLSVLDIHLDVGALNERIRSVREEPRWF